MVKKDEQFQFSQGFQVANDADFTRIVTTAGYNLFRMRLELNNGNHAVAFIRDISGMLHFFDPNYGTYLVNSSDLLYQALNTTCGGIIRSYLSVK